MTVKFVLPGNLYAQACAKHDESCPKGFTRNGISYIRRKQPPVKVDKNKE